MIGRLHLPIGRAGIAFVLLVALASASSAFAAQTVRVRVTAERATIWRPGFLTPAGVANRDALLDVVGRRGNWLEVVLPSTEAGASRETGFIALTQVTIMSGTLPAADPLADRPVPAGARGRDDAPSTPGTRPAVGVRAFGDITSTAFTAKDTFKAVFGSPSGVFFGGGAEVRMADVVFVQAAIRRYRATGERVFVSNGEVFPLGIEDTLTLTPVTFTFGGRVPLGHLAAFAGAGIGFEQVRETSKFSEAGDDTDQRIRTYHVAGGVEWKSGVVGVAGEVGFTRARNALSGGLADIYGEHDLGGIDVRIRVLIGR
jgi:hypothetical protein